MTTVVNRMSGDSSTNGLLQPKSNIIISSSSSINNVRDSTTKHDDVDDTNSNDEQVLLNEEEKKQIDTDSKVVVKVEEESEEEIKKKKLLYSNWPYRDIKEPHPNDVLYGRGGGTNHHVGNKRFRKMVEERKIDYVNCKRLDKPLVALGIIREWRNQIPTGRFLKMDEKTGLWNDVGDRKAREKTSQALREKAPQIREELEKDRIARERRERGESTEDEDDDDDDEDGDPIKSTRFANGTSSSNKKDKPAIVARDHSLGREYLNPEDNMSVEGFSWQEPVAGANNTIDRAASHSSYNSIGPPSPYGNGMLPGSRVGSYSSSMGGPPMSVASFDHSMPPPDAHARYASWNRYESWGSLGPPPPSHAGYGPYPVQSGGWTSREHSLGAIPLKHANVSQAAYPAAFDHRIGSGTYWGPPPPHHPHHPQYAHPPPMDGGPPRYHVSGGPYPHPQPYPGPPVSRGPPPPHVHVPVNSTAPRPNYYNTSVGPAPIAPKSPTYNVDPIVASQWSGRDQNEIALTLSGSSCEERDTFVSPPITMPALSTSTAPTQKGSKVDVKSSMKPDLIKRATSNQNETVDTKPDYDGKCVKRAALNRDSSQAANALKAKYMPGYFDPKTEVDMLSTNLEQSTLDPTLPPAPPKPAQYTNQDRKMTLDIDALDLVIKPTLMRLTSRSTTIEALNIDFDDDNDYYKGDPYALSSPAITEFDRDLSAMEDIFNESRVLGTISRPSTLRASQRLTTSDLIDIVNEPLSDNE